MFLGTATALIHFAIIVGETKLEIKQRNVGSFGIELSLYDPGILNGDIKEPSEN